MLPLERTRTGRRIARGLLGGPDLGGGELFPALLGVDVVGELDSEELEDGLIEPEVPLQLRGQRGAAGEVEENVASLGEALHLVGQLLTAPLIDLEDLSPVARH